MSSLMYVCAVFLCATLYSLVFEYVVHKYILHNHKYFKSAFKNHFGTHHKTSRKSQMYDAGYETIVGSKFEMISLTIVSIIHLPIIFFSTLAYFTLMANLVHYYYIHRKSHIDVNWGRANLPWHYAHHMGKNQNMNWGVRSPMFDKLLRTSSY